jgi:hypothetical protein
MTKAIESVGKKRREKGMNQRKHIYLPAANEPFRQVNVDVTLMQIERGGYPLCCWVTECGSASKRNKVFEVESSLRCDYLISGRLDLDFSSSDLADVLFSVCGRCRQNDYNFKPIEPKMRNNALPQLRCEMLAWYLRPMT